MLLNSKLRLHRLARRSHPFTVESTALTGGLAYLLMVLSTAVNVYLFVLFVRVLLSWFPNIDFSNPLLGGVASITDPYLNMFRGVIPPIGGIDLSALLAFITLNLLQSLLMASSAQFQSMSFGF